MHQFSKQGFEKPTSIQSQALPCALKGRDVIGIAKTGSGKTLAYLVPMIVHILDQVSQILIKSQRVLDKGEGPIGLVVAPTRELCLQIYMETKRYTKKYSIQ